MLAKSTLEQLSQSLNNALPNKYGQVLKKHDLGKKELAPFATWKKGDYTRNCLLRTPEYELILLCWSPQASTPIHGHGGQDCWVYQVSGEVEEVRFEEQDGEIQEKDNMCLTPGKLTYMHDRMGYHTINNESDERAMTLHLYANPIDECEVFNEDKDCFETKEMAYDIHWDEEKLEELA